MKVLLVHNKYKYRGGEETYVETIQKILSQNGHEVLNYTKDNRDIGNTITSTTAAKRLFFDEIIFKELFDLIKNRKPDIVHVNNIYPLIGPSCYKAFSKFNIPVIQTIHNYREICPKSHLYRSGKPCEDCVLLKFKYPAILHKCYHQSYFASLLLTSSLAMQKLSNKDKIITKYIFPSIFTRNYHFKYSNISVHKAEVIYHTSFNESTIHKKEYFSFDNKQSNILKSRNFVYIGRLSEEKGLSKLLRIFSENPTWNLIVVGDGPLYDYIKKKRPENVVLKGHISNKEKMIILENSYFTVIPSSSLYETGSFTMIESLESGVPIIGPKTGIFKEIITNKKQGFLYQTEEVLVNALKEATKLKISDYLKMKEESRKTYIKNFSNKLFYNRLLNVYSKAFKLHERSFQFSTNTN